jgi:pyruvate/2-oxoglutarate/acetoin dehydrogenase E1 component
MSAPKFDPWFRNRLIRDAMYAATYERMVVDPSVYLMGEGAGVKVHFDCREIEKNFPDRVITLPISEDANTNFAVGMALGGVTPVVDVISSDFLFRTMDAICNTAAKQAHTSGPRTIVIKAEFLTGGPTTGQRIEAMFTGVPGLEVKLPSNPWDAYWSMRGALARKGVTIIFEDRMIEDATTPKHHQGPVGNPDDLGLRECLYPIRQHGTGVTVVSYGIMTRKLLAYLPSTVEHIDLCSLYPLNVDVVAESVAKTRRLLVVEPDIVHGGIGAEIVASVAERVSGFRVKRLGMPRKVIPVSYEVQQRWLPSEQDVLRALSEFMA